jgi:TPP-dependent pyruvate/acetoin dehydrogenase alpha subunit
MHTTADDGSRCEPPGMRDAWRPKDPLLRVQLYLKQQGLWSEARGAEMDQEIAAELDRAWQTAQAEPPPSLTESISHVFAEMTPRLRAQAEANRENS